MTRALVLACLIALTITAPAAPAATAPARVAFSIASQVPNFGSAAGASGGVALPGGSVVTFAYDHPTQTTLALKLQPNGVLDPAFGAGGIAAIATPAQTIRVDRAERLADGKLLIAGTQHNQASPSPPRIVLVRLMPDGALDPSFGADGFVPTSLGSPAGGFVPTGIGSAGAAGMAVAPDGSIVITGSMLSPTEPNPPNPYTSDWVVVKLSPDGVADAGFGVARIAVGSGRRSAGTSVVVTPTGSIVVLGYTSQAGTFRTEVLLAGLTALGTPDPSFNAGAPVVVPHESAQRLHRRASGALDVVGGRAIVRYNPGGTLDTSFAAGGKLAFTERQFVTSFVPTPDGGALVIGLGADGTTPDQPPPDPDRRITVHRLTAGGVIAGSTTLYTPFGGGTVIPTKRAERSVLQNTFDGGLLRRDDGSYLVIGAVSIYHPTGKMDGLTAPFVAVQGFTPMLTPDRSFGGPQQPARFAVQVRPRRAVTAAARDFISLRVTASQAGLVSLRVRDRANRILASGTHPVYAAGTAILNVRLTPRGKIVLARARKGSPITIRHSFRDILTAGTTAVTRGRLR